jgi:hypothetical protein
MIVISFPTSPVRFQHVDYNPPFVTHENPAISIFLPSSGQVHDVVWLYVNSWNIHMVWDKPQMCHSQPKKKQSGTLRYSNPSATAAFYMTVTSKLPIHKRVPNESPHVMRDFPIETQ